MSVYYKVGDKKFYNNFLAYYESFKTNKKISFHLHEELYDSLNWEVEPQESFEMLMDNHAFHLRQKYDYLILNWSGGTDSHTIYNVFKRNQIHLDEICVKYSHAETTYFPESNAAWLKNNHWDPTTKITIIHDQEESRREVVLTGEDWLMNPFGGFRRYGTAGLDMGDIRIAKDSFSHRKWAIITGFEKPEVIFSEKDQKWYATMKDVFVNQLLGTENNIESFFLDPKIHLKQNHMLKNFLKLKKEISNKDPYGYYRNHTFSEGITYYVTSKAIGRHEELNHGISFNQKIRNRVTAKTVIVDNNVSIQDFITPDQYLKDRLLAGTESAFLFVKGFYNLRSEKNFWNYLNENYFNSKDAIYAIKGINSKYYCLGD